MEEYPYLVVSLLSDDGTKLGFNSPLQSSSFILVSRFNLIEVLFNGLELLFQQSPYLVTVSNLLSNLLSSENNRFQFCCSLLPPHSLQPLCVGSQLLENIRIYLYICTLVCEGIECFEVDSKGKYTPIQPLIDDSTQLNDLTLVKEVTDAFQNKLLELRQIQENQEDTTEVYDAIQLIWKNVRLLWNLDDCPGIETLDERWKDILYWERSTRKKQVKTDAKIVLATRLCLEQGKIRRRRESNMNKLTSAEGLKLLKPFQLWCILILSEYFRSFLVSHSILCYIHTLLCTEECNYNSNKKLSHLKLPNQLIIDNIIEKEKEISGIAKRLLIHCHKYQIPRVVPNIFSPESESEDESTINNHDQELDYILEEQLQLSINKNKNKNKNDLNLQSSIKSPINSKIINNTLNYPNSLNGYENENSLSILSGVRQPPQPYPYSNNPFERNIEVDIEEEVEEVIEEEETMKNNNYYPQSSEYEPNISNNSKVDLNLKQKYQIKNSSINNSNNNHNNGNMNTPTSNMISNRNKTPRSFSQIEESNDISQGKNSTPKQNISSKTKHNDITSNSKDHLSKFYDNNLNQNESQSQVAFGRSISPKVSNRILKTPENNYLSSTSAIPITPTTSTIYSIETNSIGDQNGYISPKYAQRRSVDRIRDKKQLEYEMKLKVEQENLLKKEKLRTLELKAAVARLNHQPSLQTKRSQSAPTTPTNSRQKNNNTSTPLRNTNEKKTTQRLESTSKVPEKSFISPDEARSRALSRLREHREKLEREKINQENLKRQKEKQKWDERDKKIKEFIARQESLENQYESYDSSPISNKSSPTSKNISEFSSKLRINWDAENQPLKNRKQQQQQQNQDQGYNRTLVNADEVSGMIDQTLGIETGISTPSFSSKIKNSNSNVNININSQKKNISTAITPQKTINPPIISPSSLNSSSVYNLTKLTDMICIKVLRVFSIPTDISINDMNPYVVFDWDTLGKAATHSIQQTFTPEFNSILKFHSPLPHGSSIQETLLYSPPLLIQLYSRQHQRQSQSQSQQNVNNDKLIASNLINDVSLFDFNGDTIKIKLIKNGTKNILGGIVEFDLSIV